MLDIGHCPPGVEFDEERHVYRVDGQEWSGVSARLKVLDPDAFSGVDPDLLARASSLGRRFHYAVALDVRGWLDLDELDDDLIDYFLEWRAWREREQVEVLYSEVVVVSRRERFAGMLDLVIRRNGRLGIVDMKRVYSLPRTVGPQTAGYALAFAETFNLAGSEPLDRFALHFPPDAQRARLVPLTSLNDRAAFLAANNVLKWRNAA